MFTVNPLIFSVEDKNYYYDDSTGLVFPINNEQEQKFLEEVKIGGDIDAFTCNDQLKDIFEKVKKYNLFSVKHKIENNHVSASEAKQKILTKGLHHLLFNVTDECNLRCKYCVYSEHYEFSKKYSSNKMNFDTAKKAIDYFVKINNHAIQYNPNLNPTFGFYGGEPLLEWNTIKKIVEYIKSYYPDAFFTITTNGVLLNEENIEFMLDNNFSVSVSLDGDLVEHDRNRVDISGKGTFLKVFYNISLLNEIYNYKKKENIDVQSYSIVMTHDNLTDLTKLNSFYQRFGFIGNHLSVIGMVSDINTDYYENQNTPEILSNCINQRNELLNLYKFSLQSNKENRYLKLLFDTYTLTCRTKLCYSNTPLQKACIPGTQKLMVDSNGKFHICEKLDPQHFIGDVYNGLDFDKISNYINDYVSIRSTNCSKCNVHNICPVCYLSFQSENGLKFNEDLCRNFKNNISNMFRVHYELLESSEKYRKYMEV